MNVRACIKYLKENHGLEYYIYDKKNAFGFPSSVRLDVVWNDYRFSSWGVDEVQDLAFFKALVELIERVSSSSLCSLYYKKDGLFNGYESILSISESTGVSPLILHPDNSNGSACHLSLKEAKRSALLELVERHVILSALILRIPPVKSEQDFLFKLPEGYVGSFFYWKLKDLFVVVVAVTLPSGGIIFSHACDWSLQASSQKAFNEIVTNIIYAEDTKSVNLKIDGITPGRIASFNTYWRYSGDRRAIDFLENKEQRDLRWDKLPFPKAVYYSSIPIPNSLKEFSGKLVCVRAISPDAQQLFFDDWSDNFINKRVFTNYSLPAYPHIIC